MEIFPGSRSSIRQIVPLKDGGAVFAAADPAWGVLTETGKRTRYVGSQIADFRNDPGGLEVSKSGSIVRFSFEPGGKAPAEFSVRYQRLRRNPHDDDEIDLTPPKFGGSELEILGWKDSRHPTLNGQPLELEQPDEMSRSLAVIPSEEAFLIGSDWNIYKFDSKGAQVWRKRSPGEVWALNVARNGKVGVGAFADGTIRWFRMDDGEPLLNFFAEPGSNRWICWTPSGYYAASEGGEALAGWHMNRGKKRSPTSLLSDKLVMLFADRTS